LLLNVTDFLSVVADNERREVVYLIYRIRGTFKASVMERRRFEEQSGRETNSLSNFGRDLNEKDFYHIRTVVCTHSLWSRQSMRDLHREVAEIGVDALVNLSRLLGDEKVSARIRFQIAKEVLDRAGLG
jgi:hypothetical protein